MLLRYGGGARNACTQRNSSPALLLQWGIEAEEDTWDALEGYQRGQTQTDYPRDDEMAVWAHPIDIHFQCLVCPLCALQTL